MKNIIHKIDLGHWIIAAIFFIVGSQCNGQVSNTRISLNGVVPFEQTVDAFPPSTFTRTIPVPGLVDLAMPKIDQYDEYFAGKHAPRYSWFKFQFDVEEKDKNKFAILKMLKSFFNTQVIINGHDCGAYMQGSTPIDVDLTPFIAEGNNILLIRLGDRAWMPKEAATGFDREKYTDIPGIWDDIFIELGGPIKVHRALALPDLKNKKVTAKIQLENYANIVERNMEYSEIEYTLNAQVVDKKSGESVSNVITKKSKVGCQQMQMLEFDIDINNPIAWSPDNPHLYELMIATTADKKYYDDFGNKESIKPADNQTWIGMQDQKQITFGMRDFESVGTEFHLNGSPIHLYGSTITLNRFFEDKDRAHLPWDREWVEDLMVNIPKALKWNFFRVSIGVLPEFWYDLADEHGILIQNEYLMWNLRGRPSGYEKEYTDWIWSDGNHPSIVIWDALNEQKQDYIGKVLIPKLKKLDTSRIWDLGYMKAEDLAQLQMEEIHWYPLAHGWWVNDDWFDEHMAAFRFGEVTRKYEGLAQIDQATTPVIVNEFGWQWQSRDGLKSGVRTFGNFADDDVTPYDKNYESFEPDGSQLYDNRDTYLYFLGAGADAQSRRDFQAYILAIESEILRSSRQVDGLASFAYLTNNNGYTGDWFIDDIKDLKPSQGLLVQYHTCRPFAAFIDVQDARYLKNPEYFAAGSSQTINVNVVNDNLESSTGVLTVKLVSVDGMEEMEMQQVSVDPQWQKTVSVQFTLPSKEGGYMLLTELKENGSDAMSQVSRRYIQVGKNEVKKWPNYQYVTPSGWPSK